MGLIFGYFIAAESILKSKQQVGDKHENSIFIKIVGYLCIPVSIVLFYWIFTHQYGYYTSILFSIAAACLGGFIYIFKRRKGVYESEKKESSRLKIDGLIVIVLIVSLLGCYYSYGEISLQNAKKTTQLKELHGNSYNFGIDSLDKNLLTDNMYGIKKTFYRNKDSILYVFVTPKYDNVDTFYINSLYQSLYDKYAIAYALNISGILVVKAFTQDSIKIPNFSPKLIWFFAKPNTSLYDSAMNNRKL